jgi:hypothetical protein
MARYYCKECNAEKSSRDGFEGVWPEGYDMRVMSSIYLEWFIQGRNAIEMLVDIFNRYTLRSSTKTIKLFLSHIRLSLRDAMI